MIESDSEFADAHDQWLAGYQEGVQQVWCSNRSCDNSAGVEIRWVSEFGQSWFDPEECFICKGRWLTDPPEIDEESEE